MQQLRLSFDTEILGEHRIYTIEVPYQNGVVATSEFCPTTLLSGTVVLMAAIHGESLDKFMTDCKSQLAAMSKIGHTDNVLDLHIGGLMAVVMDHLSRNQMISLGKLLIYVDCFCLLLKAAGFDEKGIYDMYPKITKTICDLYPSCIEQVSLNNKP